MIYLWIQKILYEIPQMIDDHVAGDIGLNIYYIINIFKNQLFGSQVMMSRNMFNIQYFHLTLKRGEGGGAHSAPSLAYFCYL
jgi:hypothetical protein